MNRNKKKQQPMVVSMETGKNKIIRLKLSPQPSALLACPCSSPSCSIPCSSTFASASYPDSNFSFNSQGGNNHSQDFNHNPLPVTMNNNNASIAVDKTNFNSTANFGFKTLGLSTIIKLANDSNDDDNHHKKAKKGKEGKERKERKERKRNHLPSSPSSSLPFIINKDYCATCGGGGHFICCDGCPRSFHFACACPLIDPMNIPSDSWYCIECITSAREKNGKNENEKRETFIEKVDSPSNLHSLNSPSPSPSISLCLSSGKRKKIANKEKFHQMNQIWSKMIENIKNKNPKVYQLPKVLCHYTSPSLEKILLTLKREGKREMKNSSILEKETNDSRERRRNSNVKREKCHHCGKGGTTLKEEVNNLEKFLYRCSKCSLLWHVDCVNSLESSSLLVFMVKNKSWTCPAHVPLFSQSSSSCTMANGGLLKATIKLEEEEEKDKDKREEKLTERHIRLNFGIRAGKENPIMREINAIEIPKYIREYYETTRMAQIINATFKSVSIQTIENQ